jgi:predicted MFS family arabinose efflux permease
MALYSVVFLGSTPIGAPLAGWLSESIDPRAALVMAGVAALVGGILARLAFERARPAPPPTASARPA